MKKINKILPPIPVDNELKSIDKYLEEYSMLIGKQIDLFDKKRPNINKLEDNNLRMCEISVLLWYLGLKRIGKVDEIYKNKKNL